MTSVATAEDDLKLENFALSPDGSIVAFQFIGWKSSQHANIREGIGLYDWRTGRLDRIPNPSGMRLQSPSFSPDGKQLAVHVVETEPGGQVANSIAVLNLATNAITEVTSRDSRVVLGAPVFRPGTNDIFFTFKPDGAHEGMKSIDVKTKYEQNIIDPMNGFFTIFKPIFVKRDILYFQGTHPYDASIRSQIKEFSLDQIVSTVTYRLKLGEKPEVAFPNIEIALHGKIENSGLHCFAASDDENVIVFNKLVVPETSSHYEMDIFKLNKNDETITRLTNTRDILGLTVVSHDGSTVAFGIEQVSQRAFDLYILDLKTNNVIQTGLRAKINADRRFYAD